MPAIRRVARRTARRTSRRQNMMFGGNQTEPSEQSTSEQLEELTNLKNQGIITQEEFDAKKKQILGI